MELSVIIVNWNTKELLLEAVRSIYDNAPHFPFEVIVVDNGSRDGSPQALRGAFPHVHLIENQENLGFARAVNQAMEVAKGRYLLLFNSDARALPETIEPLWRFMEERPDAAIAGPQLLDPDGTKQNSIAPFPSLATELLNKRFLRFLLPTRFPGKEREYSHPIPVDSLVGACMMVRRKAVEEVGGLDEGYFLFLEETDWCWRMWERGWKVYFVPQAKAVHLQGGSVAAVRAEAKIEYYRSRYRFFRLRKKRSYWVLLFTIPGKLIFEISGSLPLVFLKRKRERLRVLLRLLLWHIKLCPEEEGLRRGCGARY